jgi:hypothetical protein
MSHGGISIKTIIVLVILVLVGVLGVLGVNTVRTYMSGASVGVEPKNTLATPGEDGRSGVITWTTDKAAQGIVEYGTTPASLLLRGLEADTGTDHKVTLTPLKPNTSYYFRIRVGEEVFDNSGIPFSFKTKGADGAAVTTVKVTPTVVPMVSVAPVGGVGAACNRTTDYNKDGVINTMDIVLCLKGGGIAGPTIKPGVGVQAPTLGVGVCSGSVDYDGNGVINSLDRIKCLQNKK